MAKLTRITSNQFASAATSGQIGEFGSKAAGSPTTTADPAAAQSLSQWLAGWDNAVINGNSPCIEDMNALGFVLSYLISYLCQAGVAEWDSGTTYYKGSLVNSAGVVYVSITDTNLNNAVTNQSNWTVYQGGITRGVTSTDASTSADGYLRCDPTGASFVETLPAAASTPLYKKIVVKNIATNGNTVTVKGHSAELIDQANTIILNSLPVNDSISLINNGSGWDIV